MSEERYKWLKRVITVVILGVIFQQGTARAKNIGIAETNLEAAKEQAKIVEEYEVLAQIADDSARSAESRYVQRALDDSIKIAETQRDVRVLTARADSIGDSLAAQLAAIDLVLAQEFDDFKMTAAEALVASQRETIIERSLRQTAERNALLWKRARDAHVQTIVGQKIEINDLKTAAISALAAASSGIWLSIQADWWVGAIGFGLGVIVTR